MVFKIHDFSVLLDKHSNIAVINQDFNQNTHSQIWLN
jgi:hypothetical protein